MRRACLPGNRCLGRGPLALLVVGVLALGELIGLLVINRIDPSPATGSSPPSSPQQRRVDSAVPVEDEVVTPAGGARGVHILDLLARRTPFKLDEDAIEFDASRKYKIARSFLSPDAEFGSPDAGEVCLATQSSLDRLHTLVELAQLWNGPLSLAVFVASAAQFQALRAYLALLRSCSEPVRANVRVDLVFPVGVNVTRAVPWSTRGGGGGGPEFSCSSHASLLRTLHASGGARVVRGSVKQMLYPQNHLRNVARDGCSPQKHFFVVDIDVMPKPGLWDELSDFLASANSGRRLPCAKCVFVVPTYEAREMVPVPRTKRELLAMVRRREARPFHEKSFVFNQYATNHAAWEALPHSEDGLHAAYKVQRYEFFYEPFYVAGKEVPRYDERFVGYGFTRNTQVYETHAAGFEFWVLDEAFALHRGMQNHRAKGYWRERQNTLNQRKLAGFKRDVKRKYLVTAASAKTTLPPATKPLLL